MPAKKTELQLVRLPRSATVPLAVESAVTLGGSCGNSGPGAQGLSQL